MIKLIQCIDKCAVYAATDMQVSGFICRATKYLFVFPGEHYLQFNCTEEELGSVLDNPTELYKKIKQYHIPELKLTH